MNSYNHLEILESEYAICKFPPDHPVPEWISGEFQSITRTNTELSIVTAVPTIPAQLGHPTFEVSSTWNVIRFVGALDFELTGIIAKLSNILAEHQVSIFVISTFETDYVMIQHEHLDRACQCLLAAGYQINH